MKAIINKIETFFILFFFYFGVGCSMAYFLFEPLAAIQIGALLSVTVTSIALLIDYVKYIFRKDSAFREDDFDQDDVNDYVVSPQFQKDLNEQVTKDTWEVKTKDGKGLPKIYLDKKGDLIRHWKDGTFEVIKEDLLKKNK